MTSAPPRLLAGRRGWLFAGLAANGIGQAATALACAWAVHRFFAAIGDGRFAVRADLAEPVAAVGTTLAAGLALAALRAVERVQAERLGQDYAAELRLALFDAMAGQPPRRMQARSRGATVLRFVGDVRSIRRWVGLGLPRLVAGALGATVAIGALAALSPTIAAAAVLGFALGSAVLALLSGRVDGRVREARRRQARLAANVNDQISAIAVVQVFDQVARERQRLARQGDELAAAMVAQSRGLAVLKSSAECGGALASAAVMLAGAAEIAAGALTPAQLVGAITVVGLVAPAFREFGQALGCWRTARVSFEKLAAFLAGPRLGESAAAASAAPATAGADGVGARLPAGEAVSIEFRGVCLGHALRDFSAVAPAGRLVAIVGPSGAGKSTLLALAARLAEPEAGEVLIAGRPLGDYRLAELRQSLGVVMPDLPLLRGSIERNLRYRWPRAPADEVARVAALCGIDDLLGELPAGSRTRVADAAINLSYGQRQRIAWARALLGNPAVLLLDEADANLDPASAQGFARILAGFPGTVLMVTHQYARLMQADLVWYVEAGRLAESGTPAELMDRVGRTRRLFQREADVAG